MIVIWKGMGIFILFGAAAIAFVLGFVVRGIAPDGGMVARCALPISTILSGILTIIVGFKMNAHESVHSVYFIPVQYWGFVIICVGCVLFANPDGSEFLGPENESEEVVDHAEIMNLPRAVEEKTKTRTWTNNKGKKLKGKLIGLSPDGTRVRIKSSKGKTYDLDTDVFEERDRSYIRKVHAAVDENSTRGPSTSAVPCPAIT